MKNKTIRVIFWFIDLIYELLFQNTIKNNMKLSFHHHHRVHFYSYLQIRIHYRLCFDLSFTKSSVIIRRTFIHTHVDFITVVVRKMMSSGWCHQCDVEERWMFAFSYFSEYLPFCGGSVEAFSQSDGVWTFLHRLSHHVCDTWVFVWRHRRSKRCKLCRLHTLLLNAPDWAEGQCTVHCG